jgi:hypothetical protein
VVNYLHDKLINLFENGRKEMMASAERMRKEKLTSAEKMKISLDVEKRKS